MPYAQGIIYRIICLTHPEIQYIGSTFNQLRWRWQQHKGKYKQYLKGKGRECSIYPYFTQYGIKNFKIIKIKDYIAYRENQTDNKHLSAYEQLWINKLKCINKNHAFNPLLKNKRVMKILEVTYNANAWKKKVEKETEEETAERKKNAIERTKKYIENLTPEQNIERKLRKNKKYNDKYANMSPVEKEAKLKKTREKDKEKRKNETPEQRDTRLKKQREKNARYIAKKKAEKEAQNNLVENTNVVII